MRNAFDVVVALKPAAGTQQQLPASWPDAAIFSQAALSLSTESPRKAMFRPSNFFTSSRKCGSSALQGAHHVAHMSI